MINFTALLCKRGIISRVFKAEYEIRFSTQLSPLVMWNCTNKCNLACKHCYLDAEGGLPNELATEEGIQLISEVADMKCPAIGFTGGEPLLRNDFDKLAKHAIDEGLRVILSTNGTLINRRRARKLKEIGIHYVGISLDGASSLTHDPFRRMSGSFELALKGIEACLKEGIRMTLTKMNYKETEGLLNLAIKLGVPRFCIYHLVPTGGKAIIDLDLVKEHHKEVLDFLYMKSKELEDKEIFTVCFNG